MKHLKYLLLICLAAAAACSKDKTEDPTLKAQRTALQETQAVGIYRSGEALRLFDKAKQQLFVDPTTLTFRIQDDAGLKFVSLQLESMPSDGQKVRGTFTDIRDSTSAASKISCCSNRTNSTIGSGPIKRV